jgi:hypothetical protein
MPKDRNISPRPAEALLPQGADGTGFFRPADGVRLEYNPAATQLGLEGSDRVFRERAGVDAAAEGNQVGPRVQLSAAGQAGERAEHVLPAPGGALRGDVLVADEAGQVVARAATLLDVAGHRAHPGIG